MHAGSEEAPGPPESAQPDGSPCRHNGSMRDSLLPWVVRYMTGRTRRGELAPDTTKSYWSALLFLSQLHGSRPAEHVGVATMERWLEARRGLKPSAKRTSWSRVSCFADWLCDQRVIQANPCRKMAPPRQPRREPRALDASAVAALFDVLPDSRALAIVWLEVGLGLRRLEVHQARVEDWSRRNELLRVVGKGGHERYVPVIDEARHALNAYLTEWPATVGPLVRSYTRPHLALSRTQLTRLVSGWMTDAGVKRAPRDGVSQHALRHTCASDVLDGCDDLRVVQELLGHAHLSSTAVYLRRARLGKMREAMEGRSYRE